MGETVRAAEITRLTGITYRQLDYWVLKGYIPAPKVQGSGDHRDYPAKVIPLIQRIVMYREEGYELSVAVDKANNDLRGKRRSA